MQIRCGRSVRRSEPYWRISFFSSSRVLDRTVTCSRGLHSLVTIYRCKTDGCAHPRRPRFNGNNPNRTTLGTPVSTQSSSPATYQSPNEGDVKWSRRPMDMTPGTLRLNLFLYELVSPKSAIKQRHSTHSLVLKYNLTIIYSVVIEMS